jgi:lytic murein transglycosylase
MKRFGWGLAIFLAATGAAHAAGFGACLAQVRGEALAKGIKAATFSKAMAGVEPDRGVIEAMDAQPEFQAPIWDYMAGLVDDRRISDGRSEIEKWAAVLQEAELRFGVDRHVLVSVWGVETNYGRLMGRRPLLRSLATAACFGRRQAFFRGELIETLRIVQSGEIRADALKGSWAGAFGHTQFMPSTFQQVAIDFDGDGRRDIVGSIPDALGSTANYLKRAGWDKSLRWGYEVSVPSTYAGHSGRHKRQALNEWGRSGIRNLDGTPLIGEKRFALFLPAGTRGPAFLVTKNFDAIVAYNASESYALAIAQLSDRLRGAGPFQTAWPTDDPGLSRAQRRELQELLVARGYDIGEPDGMIGARTVEAVRAFQQAAGLPVDGYAGLRVLRALKGK